MKTTSFGLGRERYFVYCALWLGCAVAIMAFSTGDAFDYYRLRREGILTDGRAVARAAHYQIIYSFNVNGIVYQGEGMTGFGIPPFERISIGDKLPIYYLPKDPKINCVGSPEKLLSNELPPVLGAVILFPTVITAVIAFRIKRSLRRSGHG
jgi:hypothetical protein